MPLPSAWPMLREHAVKALPVLDAQRRAVGIATRADFMRDARIDVLEGRDGRPRWQLHTEFRPGNDGPLVGQIMSRRVRVIGAERTLADIVPPFSDTGHHPVQVLDEEGRLAGILSQTDMVRALRRFAEPAPARPPSPQAAATAR